MKLSRKSEYTILSLIYIARNQEKGICSIKEICNHYSISFKYMESLMQVLKKNRYLKSVRGAGGGYFLSKEANKISLAEIIRLMDGPLAPVDSVSKYYFNHTPLEAEKKAVLVLKEIRDYVASKLEAVTLQDIL